jgi:hypothetical protein
MRIVDVRDEATAVFAADAAARLSGLPGVAAVTAGPGITNTITALKNAQLAQSPLLLLGGAAPTALQGRGALQDIDQRPLVAPHVKKFFKVTRVRDLGPAVADALALACSGVPGPVFVECPVDLLYDEASIRQWYADASRQGHGLADRALRWYLGRHVRQHVRRQPGACSTGRAGRGCRTCQPGRRARRAGRAGQGAAPAGGGRQPGGGRSRRSAAPGQGRHAAGHSGLPVGHGTRPAGPRPCAADAPPAPQALREADCVLLAGVPCDFRLDYGKHVRRSATLIAANRSAKDAD